MCQRVAARLLPLERLKGIDARVHAFEKDRAALEGERATVAATYEMHRRSSRQLGLPAGVAGMAALLAGLGGLAWPPLFALAVLFLLVGGALGLRAQIAHRDAARLAIARAALEGRIRDLTVAHQATVQASGDLYSLATAEAALCDAGVDVPASLEEAQARLNTQAGADGNSARQFNERVREAAAEEHARLALLAQRVDVAPQRSALEGERGRVEERLRALEQRLAARERLAETVAQQETTVAAARATAQHTVLAVAAALRLSFALATLPQELGLAPGFIVLDEPLTAFDAERAQALIALLTTGTIAEQFDQVIVISHGHAFDRSAFAYHVVMERGRVRSSTLPGREDGSPTNTGQELANDGD